MWDEAALALGAPESYALLWREAAARFPGRRFEILATGLHLTRGRRDGLFLFKLGPLSAAVEIDEDGRGYLDAVCRQLDGHGIAHMRGFGIASHLGLLLDVASVGCGKSRLVGEYEEPGPEVGDQTRLLHEGKRVGTVLRTRARTKPIFVSPGHRIGHRAAVRWVLACGAMSERSSCNGPVAPVMLPFRSDWNIVSCCC